MASRAGHIGATDPVRGAAVVARLGRAGGGLRAPAPRQRRPRRLRPALAARRRRYRTTCSTLSTIHRHECS